MIDRSSFIYSFWNFYLGDFVLIPVALPILLYISRLFGLRKNDSPPQLVEIITPLIVWSIIFEIAGPHFVSAATADYFDILAYFCGAVVSWFFWNYRVILSRNSFFSRILEKI
ncbi:MAG: hypothetical protein L6407_02530 [Candidatus Delongbacteria bacterium]|nr:hypothetical protein [Candidatus Delongbacteria bacterium]